MPTLDWIGKSKVINHHQDVPYRVLERRYSFDGSGQHKADNGSGIILCTDKDSISSTGYDSL